jgi:hypothetical protein
MHLQIFSIATLTLFSFAAGYPSDSDATSDRRITHPGKATGFTTEPQLLSGGKIAIPLKILKTDSVNEVTAEIKIDALGKVEACSIDRGRHSMLDSIVRVSVLRSVYTPAYENGIAVPSSMQIRMEFTIDSVIAEIASVPPSIEGAVLDRETKLPLRDAVVALQFEDTTGDPDVRIGFDRYLKLLGRLPGQRYYRGVLSVSVDSAGRFAFKLLPSCRALVSVQAAGHEITHFMENPTASVRTKVKYFLDSIKKDTGPVDTLIVYGCRANANSAKINVEREQVATGLTHCLSDLIVSRTTIRQVPEAASMLLVRSGSPFDSRYFINGVPMLAPYHYGGYAFGDVDGMMISSLKDIRITLDRVAGRFSGVSGMLAEVEPGIVRPADPRLIRRPELVADFSISSTDLQLSVPAGKGKKDFIQVATKQSDGYEYARVYNLAGRGVSSALGIGQPAEYSNYTLTTSNTVGAVLVNSFGLFAKDNYIVDQFDTNSYGYVNVPAVEKSFPWGMGCVQIKPLNAKGVSFSAGGSCQYFSEGKRVGLNAFLKTAYLSNGVMEAKFDSLITTFVRASADFRVVYNDWYGSVVQRDPYGADFAYHEGGEEVETQVLGSVNKNVGRFKIGTDLAATGVSTDRGSEFLFDAGVSLLYELQDVSAGLCFGRVTGRPDIRGLPDSSYRMEESHTWHFSLPLSARNWEDIKITLQPYARIQDRCPQLDPYLYVWNRQSETAMAARGIDADVEYSLKERAVFHVALNFADGHRMKGDTTFPYEWNIPFTARGRSHLIFMDRRIHWYVDYIYSRGLFYYDFNESKYRTLPGYSRINTSIQYRVNKEPHRYITRYDGYVTINNLTDRWNLRGYYWNTSMRRVGLYLSPLWLNMGLKVAFRL